MWIPLVSLSNDEVIDEFDQWVTPSLERIRDTEKFSSQITDLVRVFDAFVSARTSKPDTGVNSLVREAIRGALVSGSSTMKRDLEAVFSTLSLVTANSDNAAKCQYPIWRRRNGDGLFPSLLKGKIQLNPVPNELKQDKVAAAVVSTWPVNPEVALDLADSYAQFLLADEIDRRQLTVLIDAYQHAGKSDIEGGSLLLAPLVAFQVRGSVAATGGHGPEAFTRQYLEEWGFSAPEGFNPSDVIAESLADWLTEKGNAGGSTGGHGLRSTQLGTETAKTRGFDFVIPYMQTTSSNRLFVQSQFYAGDSGSVSHKNVDQASNARGKAAKLFPDAFFVELVDGAGYCASLRKDLRHLLFAHDTTDFFQLRSIPIRLRRLLQMSGNLSPMEIALFVAEGATSEDSLMSALLSHLSPDQAREAISRATSLGWIEWNQDKRCTVATTREQTVHDYLSLDSVVARALPLSEGQLEGALLIPGFGPNYGVPKNQIVKSMLLPRWLDAGVIEVHS